MFPRRNHWPQAAAVIPEKPGGIVAALIYLAAEEHHSHTIKAPAVRPGPEQVVSKGYSPVGLLRSHLLPPQQPLPSLAMSHLPEAQQQALSLPSFDIIGHFSPVLSSPDIIIS